MYLTYRFTDADKDRLFDKTDDDLRAALQVIRKEKHVLRSQAAIFGYNTPAYITTLLEEVIQLEDWVEGLLRNR
jgi:hypothetical protein